MFMRRLIVTSFFVFLFAVAFSFSALAQEQKFEDPNVEYTLELPNATWRVTARPNNISAQSEFVYGDRLDGYLRVRKESLEENMTLSELARRYRDDTLRTRPGYVDGKEERFAGNLTGIVSSYEYTLNGKQMVGRIYYLKADNRTVYSLHFTGLREKLNIIRSQTDSIARSFAIKTKFQVLSSEF
jgi:hypothetical protein